jgi:hypothetical protein
MRRILSVKKLGNLSHQIRKDEKRERSLFYSFLLMQSFNDSKPIADLLKRHNRDFKYNREILNGPKMALYQSYKKFMVESEKIPALSPLTPSNPVEKQKVDEIMKSPMYENTQKISLIKVLDQFFWQLELSNTTALFSNEDHFLREIKLGLPKSSIEMSLDDYWKIDQTSYLPSKMVLRDSQDRTYVIKFLSLNSFQTTQKKFSEKYPPGPERSFFRAEDGMASFLF